MFRVEASSLAEYFAYDPIREQDLRAVDEVIRAAAPGLERHFFTGTGDGKPGMSIRMIGYGSFQYRVKASRDPIDWPVVSLALQKNYFSLYVSVVEDGDYLLSQYAGRLGKVKVAHNCARFVKAADLDTGTLAELVRRIETGLAAGELELRYGRTKKD
ncbi:DUF1801 domain-containing protein [Amycolatopsis sp. CA-230715]|uniref:DUF1801 domain-containing protein n=1 Tax=Amycolatopsis sp. CA-230715 TaxID=2745196 RepID=UPI001C02FDBB|nr:DUF1801 domain-containing protein [Amycolatopsis sp. CA-230715]QWF79457.1 hypothetical protein HUW46_02865 [Amycolatopsis sp. CA-230715]